MNFKLFLAFTLLFVPVVHAEKKPFTAKDLVQLKRVSSPQISPDDQAVVYVLRSTDMQANRGRTDLWLSNIEDQKAIQLTHHQAADYSPKWSADGRYIYFLSSRTEMTQVWSIDRLNNNKIQQVTDFPLDISSFKISPDSAGLLFSVKVYPNCNNFDCSNKKIVGAREKTARGQVFNRLFVRHWDQWLDPTQSQLFWVKLNKKGVANKQQLISVSKSVNASVPSRPFGGDEEYDFSSDGQSIYFSARLQNNQESSSTNFDLYRVDLKLTQKTDQPRSATLLTKNNPALDNQPVISHDGKTLAYLAMRRAGFEADRQEVVLLNLKNGKSQSITKNWDRSFNSIAFSKNDQSLYLTGNHLGTRALWRLNIKTGQHDQLSSGGYVSGLSIGHNRLIYRWDSLTSPAQIYSANLDGSNPQLITFVNQEKLAQTAFGDYQQFSFKGWNNEKVYGYVVKPANFVADKKYPLAFLIHGGPQGSFGDHFHYRWNPQTYAGQGYATVMIDFHGSTGYGQAFTDSISQHWGDRPLEDLQKGLAFALKKFPFIDGDNACALGASYGGYMINWIAGNWQNQFKCLVNHDGIFDNRMMYYTTDELWFVEWENGGSYFSQKENHERFNPANYVNQWKTPMLVVQGGNDFRIPETQSLATFTALQKKGIESKLLYFPEENHWVLAPANSIQWHHQVNQWLRHYLYP